MRWRKNKSFLNALKENWSGFLFLFLLISCGLLNQLGMGDGLTFFFKTLTWHVLGLTIFVILTFFIDYRTLSFRLVWYIYLFLNFILLVMFFLKKRWLNLGFFNFQPSEFLKPLLVFIIGYIASLEASPYLSKRVLIKLLIILGVPLILVMRNHLEYSLVMGFMFFTYLIFIGIERKVLITIFLSVVIIGAVVIPIGWKHLKPYQKGRIYGYLYPEKYAKTWGYQLNQSLIAIGSGGLFGHGFKKGWSTRLNYIPAKHTDLAFAVWCETWGFLGASIFFFLYGSFLFFALKVSQTAKDWLGKYISLGVVLILSWQIFFNVGGITGILPMTGIPFPFLSYGGSYLISLYILLSLLFNIALRRYFFK
ncbi:FtsW/RodA/SpoVE family cell cycle protein [Thermodesulfobacterium hydrogeniphilum]|uniref:FtsW/RodA/SpoVE family cell cycle protein n=1 Tax=Thermodesulfobacterium hydrogeniphilum TaxID=161156 RepID=UPI00056EB482|nr:FtsW/RodA/SpoVE family cell cycle protein [Thermodesulfobacterium hydrogeniphilum]